MCMNFGIAEYWYDLYDFLLEIALHLLRGNWCNGFWPLVKQKRLKKPFKHQLEYLIVTDRVMASCLRWELSGQERRFAATKCCQNRPTVVYEIDWLSDIDPW